MILYQNRLIPKAELHISHEDRGYYFGDGVYEVFRVYNGTIFEPDAHWLRLKRSLDAIKLRLPDPLEVIERNVAALLAASQLKEGTIYLQITRGITPRAHAFPADTEPVLMAYCNEVSRPLASMNKGISAVTLDDIRWLRCDIKSLNLLPNILAKQEAIERGVGEVILHRNGMVTECSASNVMIVRNGEIITHPANNLILHGVTRAYVLNLAKQLSIPVAEQPFTVGDLKEADEVFITGTTVEVTPIIEVDGIAINQKQPGPIVRKLQEAFEQSINHT